MLADKGSWRGREKGGGGGREGGGEEVVGEGVVGGPPAMFFQNIDNNSNLLDEFPVRPLICTQRDLTLPSSPR